MPEASVAPAPAPVSAPVPATKPAEPTGKSSPGPAQLSPRPLGTPPAGLPPPVGKLLASPGPGEPLPTSVQGPIAERLGVDPRAVRVHAGPDATAAADALAARAFAYGTHVFVGRGQKPTDLALMAHEVAHVVQQEGGAVVQRSAFAGAQNGLELEAQAAGAAVARGQRATVVGRTAGPRIQGSLFGSIVSGIKAVGSAIADLGKAAWDAALNFIKEHARSIPGYDLLSFILGKDPITQQPVDRSAMNLIKGLVGLIPGGAEMFENIQKAGVLQKIADWFNVEVEKLDLSWAKIRALFEEAWNALSASDILSPSTAWEKIKKIFGPPVGRLVDFAKSAGKKLLEFIFEGAIALGGGAAQQVLGFFRRVQSVFGLIVSDPVKFFSNLVAAAKGGFEKFAKNIVEHLKKALFNWLFGALAGALKLPAKFDLMGIIDVVLQVLGLTYDRFRERLVKLFGEPAVQFLEKAFEFLKILVTQGIAAAWQKLLEFASGMVDTVIAMIRDWVVKTIVGQAVLKLVSMFNPIGAIIQAIIGIYNTVMFFIEKAKEVMALLNAIVDSIENIAKGNIAGAIDYVEKMLASALVVIINFLARFAGLSKVADAIKDTIKKIQDTVWKAIDKAIDWIKGKVKDLLGKKQEEKPSADDTYPEAKVDVGTEKHTVIIEGGGENAAVFVRSDKKHVSDFLKELDLDTTKPAEFKAAVTAAGEVDKAAKKMNKEPKDTKPAAKVALGNAESNLASILKKILEGVSLTSTQKYELEGHVATYGSVSPKGDDLQADHQPQSALLTYVRERYKTMAPDFKNTKMAHWSPSQGWAINLHFNRHKEGRTWGTSSKAAGALKQGKGQVDDALTTNAGKPKQARAAVTAVLTEQLGEDVKAMLNVVKKPAKDPVWVDLNVVAPPKKREEVIAKIQARVRQGEARILAQPLHEYENE